MNRPLISSLLLAVPVAAVVVFFLMGKDTGTLSASVGTPGSDVLMEEAAEAHQRAGLGRVASPGQTSTALPPPRDFESQRHALERRIEASPDEAERHLNLARFLQAGSRMCCLCLPSMTFGFPR